MESSINDVTLGGREWGLTRCLTTHFPLKIELFKNNRLNFGMFVPIQCINVFFYYWDQRYFNDAFFKMLIPFILKKALKKYLENMRYKFLRVSFLP